MFYFLWGAILAIVIIIAIKILRWLILIKKNHRNYHYFIIVKNGQEMIEWLIRSISIASFIEGKQKKITVIDLGSTDDTLAIMERFLVNNTKVDNLYTRENFQLNQLSKIIKASHHNGEKPIIIYLNPNSDSLTLMKINNEVIESGESTYKNKE